MSKIVGGQYDKSGEKVVCDKCGGTEHKFYMHTDGQKEYSYTFVCKKCKNYITITEERKGEDLLWWVD